MLGAWSNPTSLTVLCGLEEPSAQGRKLEFSRWGSSKPPLGFPSGGGGGGHLTVCTILSVSWLDSVSSLFKTMYMYIKLYCISFAELCTMETTKYRDTAAVFYRVIGCKTTKER